MKKVAFAIDILFPFSPILVISLESKRYLTNIILLSIVVELFCTMIACSIVLIKSVFNLIDLKLRSLSSESWLFQGGLSTKYSYLDFKLTVLSLKKNFYKRTEISE